MASRNISKSSSVDEQYDSTTEQCPECGGSVHASGIETICGECGLVIDEHRIDHGPEWRTFNSERERTGAPITAARHDRGLSTDIGYVTTDQHGSYSGRKRRRMTRMRRQHSRGRFRSKRERNLSEGLGEVRRMCSALELSKSIRDQACHLLRQAQDADLFQGRSIEAMAAASVYGTLRCNGVPRTLDEIVGVARVDASRVRNAYTTINAELGLAAQPVGPSAYVPNLASTLEVPDRVRVRASTLARVAEEATETIGVAPAGFAAACLYKAAAECRFQVTQADAGAAADVSP
ncbi:MAG: transcription initiation factor IIB, partial [Halorhabdus sp.]